MLSCSGHPLKRAVDVMKWSAITLGLHTAGLRQTQQLFAHYQEHSQERPLSKQHLAHWLFEAITQVYAAVGVEAMSGIHAHTARTLSSSAALLGGMTVEDICTTASWASV